MESSIKKENFKEILDLWNDFNSLKEENDLINKIFENEMNNSRKANIESCMNLRSNKSENINRTPESDVILYSYRKDNERNNTNSLNLYQSCLSVRNKHDEKTSNNSNK